MSNFSAESGAQLVARITSNLRPTLEGLNKHLFPNYGPKPMEAIEISGGVNVGKTLLLLEIIAQTILPTDYDGKGISVIFIDLNANFPMFMLMSILEKHVLHHKMKTNATADTEELCAATSNVQEIVHAALKNIISFNCFSGEEFEFALINVTEMLSTRQDIGLLAIDSLGAFYWTDRTAANPKRMDTYLGGLVERLHKITSDHRAVLIYTKSTFFGNKGTFYDKQIDYRIELIDRSPDKFERFDANINYKGKLLVRDYAINRFGIKWLDSNKI